MRLTRIEQLYVDISGLEPWLDHIMTSNKDELWKQWDGVQREIEIFVEELHESGVLVWNFCSECELMD